MPNRSIPRVLGFGVPLSVALLLLGLLSGSTDRIGYVLGENRVDVSRTGRGLPLPWVFYSAHTPVGGTPGDYTLPGSVPYYEQWRSGWALRLDRLVLAMLCSAGSTVFLMWLVPAFLRDLRKASLGRAGRVLFGLILFSACIGAYMTIEGRMGGDSYGALPRAILLGLIPLALVPAIVVLATWAYASYAVVIVAFTFLWHLAFAAHLAIDAVGGNQLAYAYSDFAFLCGTGLALALLITFFRLEFGKRRPANGRAALGPDAGGNEGR